MTHCIRVFAALAAIALAPGSAYAAPGVPVPRYRLYSPVTLEHHFTTDLNEYTVLGSNGNWIQEGTVGMVLDNPGSFNGVTAVPYYRLYDTTTRWHHWTTDANEYNTLAQSAGWHAEGIDGYVLPSHATGSTQLFRLNYPAQGSLHHWTIDAAEYASLVADFGWIGEGGAGFVVAPTYGSDFQAPEVVSTFPPDAAVPISVLVAPTVKFTEAMDPVTLGPPTFTLTGPAGPVAATVSASGDTATLTPTSRLEVSSSYTATVTTGAQDAAGNPLAQSHTFSFNTLPYEPPPIVAGCPAPESTAQLRRLEWGPNQVLKRKKGEITSLRVAQSPTGRAAVSFTQGQAGVTPPGVTIDLTVSRCPGVIESNLHPACRYTTTFTNFASIAAFNRTVPENGWNTQEDLAAYGCLAPDTEQHYVNIRWSFANCPLGAEECGFSLQWGEVGY